MHFRLGKIELRCRFFAKRLWAIGALEQRGPEIPQKGAERFYFRRFQN